MDIYWPVKPYLPLMWPAKTKELPTPDLDHNEMQLFDLKLM